MQYRLLRSQVSLIEYLELDKYTMNTYAYPSIYTLKDPWLLQLSDQLKPWWERGTQVYSQKEAEPFPA